MSKFVSRRVETGMKFDLCADNGEIVAVSEVYSGLAGCHRGIESVKKCAALGRIAALTRQDADFPANPRFELYRDRRGEYRFRLRARNGKIIAISEAYTSRGACAAGIESVITGAAQADIEE